MNSSIERKGQGEKESERERERERERCTQTKRKEHKMEGGREKRVFLQYTIQYLYRRV